MTPIPAYWYTEPEGFGLSLEEFPVETFGPGPLTLVDKETGEVCCEAILMARLPSSRFADTSGIGFEVVLPFRVAEALIDLEPILSSGWVDQLGAGKRLAQREYGSRKYRVKVRDGAVYLSWHVGGHLMFSFSVSIPGSPDPAGPDPAARPARTGGSLSRPQSEACLDGGAEPRPGAVNS